MHVKKTVDKMSKKFCASLTNIGGVVVVFAHA
jgi:hypothetical protein